MKRNLDVVDECYDQDYIQDMDRGERVPPEQLKAALQAIWASQDKDNKKLVRVRHHAKIGEGDLLAIWQTNYLSDDTSREMVTLMKFRDGKIVTSKWFPAPESTAQ